MLQITPISDWEKMISEQEDEYFVVVVHKETNYSIVKSRVPPVEKQEFYMSKYSSIYVEELFKTEQSNWYFVKGDDIRYFYNHRTHPVVNYNI